MEIDNYDHGVFSWVDVTATDFEASQKFYSELFGWEIDRGPEEFGGYSMAVVNGRNVAGISPAMSPEAPPVWSTYVDVASVDDTMAKAAAGGGHAIVEPMDVGEAGRMAMFADPEGAVIGLWEAKEHRGAGLVNEPNTWAWNELMCDEPKTAKEFYAGVFGWGEVTNGEGDNQYTEWQVGGRSIGGMLK
jgi:predicted enzyme related to lactoylglutathione lyase